MQSPWLVLIPTLLLGVAAALYMWWSSRTQKAKPLPDEWPLTSRPVFSSVERQLLQRLREALPQHVILAKLPLVRFCQPLDPDQIRQWYDIIGNAYVTFAVCAPNGRVLMAIDLEHDRPASRRLEKVKTSVLAACRIRLVRTRADNLPTVAEIKLMVPEAAGSGPVPTHTLQRASATLAHTVRAKRAERGPDRESSFSHDSFFNFDHSRFDSAFNHSGHSVVGRTSGLAPPAQPLSEFSHIHPGEPRGPVADVELDVSRVIEAARESAVRTAN